MSVRRVIRALGLHEWPEGAVEGGNDHYEFTAPPSDVRCLACPITAGDVILAAVGYEIVLRCEPSPVGGQT